jgi:hypothetical protein
MEKKLLLLRVLFLCPSIEPRRREIENLDVHRNGGGSSVDDCFGPHTIDTAIWGGDRAIANCILAAAGSSRTCCRGSAILLPGQKPPSGGSLQTSFPIHWAG